MRTNASRLAINHQYQFQYNAMWRLLLSGSVDQFGSHTPHSVCRLPRSPSSVGIVPVPRWAVSWLLWAGLPGVGARPGVQLAHGTKGAHGSQWIPLSLPACRGPSKWTCQDMQTDISSFFGELHCYSVVSSKQGVWSEIATHLCDPAAVIAVRPRAKGDSVGCGPCRITQLAQRIEELLIQSCH